MTGKRVYLDSSSIVKRYVEEKGSDVMHRAYEAAETGDLLVFFSIWNVGEVLSALDRYLQTKDLTSKEFGTSLSSFMEESIKLGRLGSLTVVPMSAENLMKSWSLVLEEHLYEADALQVASAKDSDCSVLLTADRRLVDASRRQGLQAYDVEVEREKALESLAG